VSRGQLPAGVWLGSVRDLAIQARLSAAAAQVCCGKALSSNGGCVLEARPRAACAGVRDHCVELQMEVGEEVVLE
jgi:hypothetical protein